MKYPKKEKSYDPKYYEKTSFAYIVGQLSKITSSIYAPYELSGILKEKSAKKEAYDAIAIEYEKLNETMTKLSETLKNGQRKQILVYIYGHTTLLDVEMHIDETNKKKKLKIVSLESAYDKSQMPMLLSLLTKASKPDYEIDIVACQAGIQYDSHNCAIFSYALSTKIAREKNLFDRLKEEPSIKQPQVARNGRLIDIELVESKNLQWVSVSNFPDNTFNFIMRICQSNDKRTEMLTARLERKNISAEEITKRLKNMDKDKSYIHNRKLSMAKKLRVLQYKYLLLFAESLSSGIEKAINDFTKSSSDERGRLFFDKIKTILDPLRDQLIFNSDKILSGKMAKFIHFKITGGSHNAYITDIENSINDIIEMKNSSLLLSKFFDSPTGTEGLNSKIDPLITLLKKSHNPDLALYSFVRAFDNNCTFYKIVPGKIKLNISKINVKETIEKKVKCLSGQLIKINKFKIANNEKEIKKSNSRVDAAPPSYRASGSSALFKPMTKRSSKNLLKNPTGLNTPDILSSESSSDSTLTIPEYILKHRAEF